MIFSAMHRNKPFERLLCFFFCLVWTFVRILCEIQSTRFNAYIGKEMLKTKNSPLHSCPAWRVPSIVYQIKNTEKEQLKLLKTSQNTLKVNDYYLLLLLLGETFKKVLFDYFG